MTHLLCVRVSLNRICRLALLLFLSLIVDSVQVNHRIDRVPEGTGRACFSLSLATRFPFFEFACCTTGDNAQDWTREHKSEDKVV